MHCGVFGGGEAEASLARAYVTAGGPALESPCSYVGTGQHSLHTKRLGGRCKDRLYRMDHADEFDVTSSGFFVTSSLAPVLRFRRRFMSVCNVSKASRLTGLLTPECRRESLPRWRLAHRARSRAFGNLSANTRVIWSHLRAHDCCFPLKGPHRSNK